MPNRILRDWTNSEKVDRLTEGAEVFFTRLFMKADDHGCFHANPKILRGQLFTLRLDRITDKDVSGMLLECEGSGLIKTYWHSGKKYLQIINFGQRLRNMIEKHPLPESADNLRSIDSNPPPETETKLNPETKPNPETEGAFAQFISEFNSITGRNFKGSEKVKSALNARLKDGYVLEEIFRAIKKCFNDPWHVENPNYLTPEFITRPDKLEKYAQYIIPINHGKQQTTNPADTKRAEVRNLKNLAAQYLAGEHSDKNTGGI